MNLPIEIELCSRDIDGHPCGRRLFRKGPEGTPYCEKCGDEWSPGIVYVKVATA